MSNSLQCVVVTPEKAVLDESADFVVVPMFDGELGIAVNRLPLIGRLGIGELRLTTGNRTRHYYIDGGFVQLRDNIVTVLTSRAVPAADINVQDARGALAAPPVAVSPEAMQAQWHAQERARAQLRIADKIDRSDA
jgi:F-type H+-transporting ATPase subunit epsilon